MTLDKCIKEVRLKNDPKTQLGKIQQSWRKFAKDIKDNQIQTKGIEEFETWLINSANVIFTTTMSLPYQKHFKPENNEIFDLVILDDANLLNIPKALIPMELGKHWVLAGDIEQFIAKVDSSIRKAIESGQGSLIASNNQTILHSKIERLLRSDINDFLYIRPEMVDRFKTSHINDTTSGSKRLTKKSEEKILISLPSEGSLVTKASFELYTNHRINKQLADIIFPAYIWERNRTVKHCN